MKIAVVLVTITCLWTVAYAQAASPKTIAEINCIGARDFILVEAAIGICIKPLIGRDIAGEASVLLALGKSLSLAGHNSLAAIAYENAEKLDPHNISIQLEKLALSPQTNEFALPNSTPVISLVHPNNTVRVLFHGEPM